MKVKQICGACTVFEDDINAGLFECFLMCKFRINQQVIELYEKCIFAVCCFTVSLSVAERAGIFIVYLRNLWLKMVMKSRKNSTKFKANMEKKL